ncbi:MAG TPA: glycosyltransferase family 39 protein, partial [Bryobacteraceae bacterium]
MQNRASRWPWLVLLLVILGTALLRWHLRSFPLERDEGEYAYAGQLMLHGIPPYTLLYTMKLPGTFFVYAVILLVFGQTSAGIHLGLLVVNAATIVLMFLVGRRLFGDLAGVVSATSYALFTASPAVLGFAGHATNFVVLAAIPGVIVLLKAIESRRTRLYFWSGLLFGVGFLMKQPGILLAVFGGVYILWSEWRTEGHNWRTTLRRVAIFAGGVALPFAATCLLMLACGVFDRFWFWTFSYARAYGSIVSLREGLQTFRINAHVLLAAERWLWLLAAIGLTTV